MNNSDEKKGKREFPKNWKPIASVPKEFLQDCGDIKLEFVGSLTPGLLAEITKDNDVKIFKLRSDD